ncbi:MAG: hypothetical protein ACE5JI_10695 [Acidobacteriota bacterium]
MATTALFAEILIVGLEAGVWLGLLVLTFTGPLQLNVEAFKAWSTSITALVLAAAYVVGILVDRAADSFYRWLEVTRVGLLINKHLGKGSRLRVLPAAISHMRLTVMKESEGMAKFLDYQRSRVRVARATVFNLALTILIGVLYLAVHKEGDPGFVAIVVLLGLLMLLSLFASERIHAAWLGRLCDAYEILSDDGRGQACEPKS